jgi:hypothetical protein
MGIGIRLNDYSVFNPQHAEVLQRAYQIAAKLSTLAKLTQIQTGPQ